MRRSVIIGLAMAAIGIRAAGAVEAVPSLTLEQATSIGEHYSQNRWGSFGCHGRAGRRGRGVAAGQRAARHRAGVRKHKRRLGMKG